MSKEKSMPTTGARTKALNPRLASRLIAYTTLASASLAFSSSPAEAEVIYTPLHKKIDSNFLLDLNHDGIDDFRIASSDYSDQGEVQILAAHGNRIVGSNQPCGPRSDSPAVAPLLAGSVIGPGKPFPARATCMAFYNYSSGNGPWLDGPVRYIGFAFTIDGKEHFGWARFRVGKFLFNNTAEIMGYAYETIPGKAIIAGDEGNSSQASAPTGTLGALALGATSRFAAEGKQ